VAKLRSLVSTAVITSFMDASWAMDLAMLGIAG
jgi:hypothetical protein